MLTDSTGFSMRVTSSSCPHLLDLCPVSDKRTNANRVGELAEFIFRQIVMFLRRAVALSVNNYVRDCYHTIVGQQAECLKHIKDCLREQGNVISFADSFYAKFGYTVQNAFPTYPSRTFGMYLFVPTNGTLSIGNSQA